jgi:6-phosphogluconolactonase
MKRAFSPLCGSLVILSLSLFLVVAATAAPAVPKFLFVANYIDGTVSVFQVQPLTGQLTQVSGSPFVGGTAIQGIALSPDQKFLYTAGDAVTAFSVNQQTGSLTQIGAYPLGSGSGGVMVTPDGKFLYSTGDGLYGFSIDSATGLLTAVPGSPFDSAVAFSGSAANPGSQYLYASTLVPNGVRGYAIQADGSLFTLPGSPWSDASSPFDVVVEPSGRFVYVVNYGGGVSGFSIAPGQGTLTSLPGSPFSTGGDAPNSIAAAADGRAIIVDNQAQDTTASLAIQSDGSLELAGTPQPAGFSTRGVTVDPTNEYVYTSSDNASTVSAYRLDPVSLALEIVPGAQWATGSNPYALVVMAGARAPYCPLNNVERSVTLCAPTTTSASPVRVVAGTTSASAVQQMTVFVDGVTTYSNAGAEAMDVFVDVPAGQHTLTVQAKNSSGQKFSLARSIAVTGTDTPGCSSRGIGPVVAICSPLAGSVTGTSIHVSSQSIGFGVVSSTAVDLDGREVYSVASATVNTYITATAGTHSLTVQAKDSAGFTWNSTVKVSVQ